jgi:hypothetical protein
MKDLSSERLWTYSEKHPDGSSVHIRFDRSPGIQVQSYRELAGKIAALQFHNPHLVLLFRGQPKDYQIPRDGRTTIRPSIFREERLFGTQEWNIEVARRYQQLHLAEEILSRKWNDDDLGDGRQSSSSHRLVRSSVIKWAVLQHYEVCPTPLLDVTLSLRIAASFASLENTTDEAYLMVLAAPQISGAVSVCAHNEMQLLRLCSLCPPSAVRPHLQEGYLLGEYPELQTIEQKMNVRLHETDFGQRLVAKFKFHPVNFWNDPSFLPIPINALYPNVHDEVYTLCESIKAELDSRRSLFR